MASQNGESTTNIPSSDQQLQRGMVHPVSFPGGSFAGHQQKRGNGTFDVHQGTSEGVAGAQQQHPNQQQQQQYALEEQRRLVLLNQAQNQQQQRDAINMQQMQYAQAAAAGRNPYTSMNQQHIFQQQPPPAAVASATGGRSFVLGAEPISLASVAGSQAAQMPSAAAAANMNFAQFAGGLQGYSNATMNSFPPGTMGGAHQPHAAIAHMHYQPMMNYHGLMPCNDDGQGSAKTPPKKIQKEEPARDMPIRSLSAYNFFFRDERARILNDDKDDIDMNDTESLEIKKNQLLEQHMNKDRTKRCPHRKTHGKISFTSLSKLIGKRWKEYPDNKKQFYRDVAAMDMDRYQRDVAEYDKGRLFQSSTVGTGAATTTATSGL